MVVIVLVVLIVLMYFICGCFIKIVQLQVSMPFFVNAVCVKKPSVHLVKVRLKVGIEM